MFEQALDARTLLLIKPLKEFYGIKVASVDDIACMKIVAVSQRAEKRAFLIFMKSPRSTNCPKLEECFMKNIGKKKRIAAIYSNPYSISTIQKKLRTPQVLMELNGMT
jgi:hypothetical protein